MILIAVLPMLALATTPANAAPAQTAVETPIGHLGDTLRIHDGDVIADVTVVSVTPSEIPAGWGYPPRPPREQVWRANVVIHAVSAPTPGAIPVSFQFRGVTPTGDAYEPRATDDPAERARRQDRVQRTEAQFDPVHFDVKAARAYGRIYAAVAAAGRKARGPRAVDLMIAAVALANDLPLYTRNPADLRGLDGLVDVVMV